ncbi:hypothetical protein [Caulobacter sp. B11]|uniref:hypothetical protein n=1 Tax=Caulobacter sp. B11 TaxID=2048899 RepID=UPI0035137FA1
MLVETAPDAALRSLELALSGAGTDGPWRLFAASSRTRPPIASSATPSWRRSCRCAAGVTTTWWPSPAAP